MSEITFHFHGELADRLLADRVEGPRALAIVARQALRGEPITVHGDGKQTRCFTYISDTIAGTLLAGEAAGALGQAFNIGNPREVSILALARTIKRLTRSKSPIEFIPYEAYYGAGFEDTRRRVPAVDKAKRLLGFTPRIDLEAGLKKTLAWCREHYRH